jgi:hypothetical protein
MTVMTPPHHRLTVRLPTPKCTLIISPHRTPHVYAPTVTTYHIIPPVPPLPSRSENQRLPNTKHKRRRIMSMMDLPRELLEIIISAVPDDERLQKAVLTVPFALPTFEDFHVGSVEWRTLTEYADQHLWLVHAGLAAARSGSISVLAWLHRWLRMSWFSKLALAAAERGQLETVRWLLADDGSRCSISEVQKVLDFPNTGILASAAASGSLPLVQWLLSRRCEWSSMWCARAAARAGALDLLIWAQNTFGDDAANWDSTLCEAAASAGHISIVRWLRERGCAFSSCISYNVALAGHFEALKFLYASGCALDESTALYAASRCDLAVLRWLRAQGCPITDGACHAAARSAARPTEAMEILRWLRDEVGCHWTEATCCSAAESDNLVVVQFLCAGGCSWSPRVSLSAASRGRLEVLQWLTANHCPFDSRDCASAAAGARNGAAVLQWIMDSKFNVDGDQCMLLAARSDRDECLQLLLDRGFRWKESYGVIASRTHSLLVLKWAHSRGLALDVRECIANAKDCATIRWLRRTFPDAVTHVPSCSSTK